MKRLVKISSLTLLIALTSCYEKEVFPDTPKIGFENLVFSDAATSTDTLELTFSFENGGNDFGIDSDQDFFPPYHAFNFYIDENDSIITEKNYENATLPIYKVPVILKNLIATGISGNTIFFSNGTDSNPLLGFNRDTLKSLADLPTLACPNITNQDNLYDTTNFTLYNFIDGNLSTKEVEIKGPLLVERVETHFNLHIRFQEKVNGEFKPISFQDKFNVQSCEIGSFNAIVPFFSNDVEKGKLTYKIKSLGFKSAFLDNEIRIIFWIYDRNLNKSNEVTHDFFLSEITQF